MIEASVQSTPGTLGPSLPPGFAGIAATTVMACGVAMSAMMLTIVLPILPEIAKEVEGGRDALVAMPTIGIVIGGAIAGFLIDRLSPRTIMLWMIVAFGIIGMTGVVLDGRGLLASRFLMGVVSTCIWASSTTLIGEFIYPEKRARVLGFQMAGSSLVGIVAMNASAYLDDSFGWRASFTLFPIIAAVVFAAGYFLIPARVETITPHVAAPGASLLQRFTQPLNASLQVLVSLWPLYLMLFALHMTAYTSNSQSSFVLADNGVGNASVRASMLSVGHTMIMLAALCYPFTRKILGSRWIPAFFLTMMASGLMILGLSHDLLLSGIALSLLGIGNGTLFPHQANLILARAAPEIRGRAVGLMVSNQFLADSINPFLFPPMIAAVGLHNSIALVGLIAAGGVVAALIYGSRAADDVLPADATVGH